MLTACSVGASYKDWVYVTTGNGIDYASGKVAAPDAPSLVCFHKDSGKVVWRDNSPGKHILEGQWSNPLVCEVKGRAQVVVAQGDGWLRSFDPATGKIWVANEYIGQTCTNAQYLADPVGTCGGTRTLLANWYTRISRIG